MAIRRQNGALLVFVVLVLAGLGYLLLKEGKLSSTQSITNNGGSVEGAVVDTSAPADEQDALGDIVDRSASSEKNQSAEKERVFVQILSDLSDCLNIKSALPPDRSPVSAEAIITVVQNELGPASFQGDHWMNWHLRTREGKEKRLRLEVAEDDSGRARRELRYYTLDREGNPVPVQLDPQRENNPSDEDINTMLKEGEVFYKDRSAYVLFPGGERIEYLEKDGVLAEIEFIRGETFFRCNNLDTRENCQCIR